MKSKRNFFELPDPLDEDEIDTTEWQASPPALVIKYVAYFHQADYTEAPKIRAMMLEDPDVSFHIEEMVAMSNKLSEPEWIKANFRILKNRFAEKEARADGRKNEDLPTFGMF